MRTAPVEGTTSSTTHVVMNQPAPRIDVNEYSTNVALTEAVSSLAPRADTDELRRIGRLVGSEKFQRDATDANDNPPSFHSHDRWGHRIDQVDFHPSYHRVIGEALQAGAHSWAWKNPGEGANVERAARFMLFSQIEPGHGCPVSMTHSAVAPLTDSPHADFWIPRLLTQDYDPRLIDPAEKGSVTFGMAMTEKQGGSDVRAGTTQAAEQQDGSFLITGHKWFCSAPQSDAFLTLAKTSAGVTCFLVPRILPGGGSNVFRIQRLKDKLGNWSNASSEIEFDETRGWLVGEQGQGVRTIIEMVNRTRLDCIYGTTSGMRQATAEAVWHTEYRKAFGRKLIDQPLMRAVIADLHLETEAATWTAAHLAAAHDEGSPYAGMRRIATALAKYWVCKRGPAHAYEALECLGGNGYTELFPLARRYREQPLLAIWEGSGNVIVLDVLRTLVKDSDTTRSLLIFLRSVTSRCTLYDRRLSQTLDELTAATDALSSGHEEKTLGVQRLGRRLVEHLAQLMQSAILLTHAHEDVARSFIAARLGDDRGSEYGALPSQVAVDLLVERAAGHQ